MSDKKYSISCLKLDNGARFFGVIENGLPNGLGALLYNDLKTDIGLYKDGLPNGFGYLRFHNGDKYFGKVFQGKIKGIGIFYSLEKQSSILGNFKGNSCSKTIEEINGDFTRILGKIK